MCPRRQHVLAGLFVVALAACGSNSTDDAGRTSGTTGAEDPRGATEQVTHLWVHAALADDGSAEIIEVIDYDFGSAQRHGIVRRIPGLAPDAEVTVSSDDAPDDLFIEPSDEVEYPVTDLGADQRIDWEAVGADWDVPRASVEIHVTAPFDLSRSSCKRWLLGLTSDCDQFEKPEPGHLVATLDDVEAGEGVTVYAAFGDALVADPVAPRAPPP
jgi:hypothetical protein